MLQGSTIKRRSCATKKSRSAKTSSTTLSISVLQLKTIIALLLLFLAGGRFLFRARKGIDQRAEDELDGGPVKLVGMVVHPAHGNLHCLQYFDSLRRADHFGPGTPFRQPSTTDQPFDVSGASHAEQLFLIR